MITPRFELSQTEDDISINIYARYANIKETEISVEGTDFHFSSPPFYLRLTLPGEIEENDLASGSYDCDTGTFLLKFPKVNKGEHFENLDMITTLLAPPMDKTRVNIGPSIEVIGNPAAVHADESDPLLDPHENGATNGDEWFVPQVASSISISSLDAPKYGFANKIFGGLSAFDSGLLNDVVDLPSPDTTPMNQRKILRESAEISKFNKNQYLENLFEPEDTVDPCLEYRPVWYNLTRETIEFTDKEKDILKELPNKEFLMDNEETQTALFGLVDILFGYCYNYRTTFGENTCESCWTINKLSATLSWFEKYSSMIDVINTCMRRSICFPLHRHWNLSLKVIDDVQAVLKIGKKYIVKCFCEIYELFNNSPESRHILNQLYIRDYLIWLQKISDSLIDSLVDSLENISPEKKDMKLELVELEQSAAWLILEDNQDSDNADGNLIIENSIHNIANGFNNMSLNNINKNGYMSDSDSSSSDSDSSTDSTMTASTSSTTSTSSSSSSSSSSSTSSDTDSDDEPNNQSQDIMKIKRDNELLDSDDDSN